MIQQGEVFTAGFSFALFKEETSANYPFTNNETAYSNSSGWNLLFSYWNYLLHTKT